jgi:phospholipid-binding lipoprotein MlaA
VRQLFKHCAHSVAMAAVLLALTTAETHAGRFLDDNDFEEAMSLQRTGPVTADEPGLTRTVVSADPAATAGNGGDDGDSVNDPVEELNRLAHRLNQEVRRFVLEPVSDAYVEATSAPVRTGVANVFSNLREPVWLAGHVLKGDWNAAETTAARFAINTTVGLGGVYDQAAEYGLAARKATLDEVFCHYGIGPGPYIVLPVLGPSSVRDATGRALTIMAQYAVLGAFILPYRVVDVTLQYIAVRDELRSLEQQALDAYAAERSVFMQLQKLSCDERLDIESRMFAQ